MGSLAQHRERRGTANYTAGALAESSLRASKRSPANAPTLSERDIRLHPEGTHTRSPTKALKHTLESPFEGPDLGDLPGPDPPEEAYNFFGATQEAAQAGQEAVQEADMPDAAADAGADPELNLDAYSDDYGYRPGEEDPDERYERALNGLP
jgi:hypothetical protein